MCQPSSHGSTVLVVDDEELFRVVAVEIIQARLRGVRVLEASHGGEALAQLGANQIDCVVTDLTMPTIGGAELFTRLINLRARVPVIVVTSHAGGGDAPRGLPPCFTKPIDFSRLCSAILSCLDAPGDAPHVTVKLLMQVLSWERRSARVEVSAGAAAEELAIGVLETTAGRLSSARIERGDATRVGVDAAVEILSLESPIVRLSGEPGVLMRDEELEKTALHEVFARSDVRRRVRLSGKGMGAA